ncbi:MAG: endonuclease III [Acidobacteria bacterium]|nr:endonuclease III [Acidobacteriota bacterium]
MAVGPASLMKDAVAVFDKLDVQHPNAWTELHFTNPYELLAATILSAQCTDARVNLVTPALFKKYPTPKALAKADPAALETLIQPTGFFRMKTKSLIGMANAVVDEHAGEIPSDMDALVALPGVGRKTANVVRGHAFNLPGLPVDRHVLRVATRIGLISAKAGEDAVRAETRLMTLMPPDRWTRASDTLTLHGRRICKPKPLCERCAVRASCAYYRRQ